MTRLGPEPKCPKSGDTSQFIGAGKVRLGLLEKEARSIIHTRRLGTLYKAHAANKGWLGTASDTGHFWK